MPIRTTPRNGELCLLPLSPKTTHVRHGHGSSLTLAGLLNALDGIEASEGRLLFATTNHKEALDPALCRPGRMDVHIEFGMASKYQAKQLFKRFYPEHEFGNAIPPRSRSSSSMRASKPSSVQCHTSGYTDDLVTAVSSAAEEITEFMTSPPSPPSAVYRAPSPAPREMPSHDIESLASRFASTIPERSCTMAMLQEYLMSYKRDPLGASQEGNVRDFLRRPELAESVEGGSGKSSRGVSIEKKDSEGLVHTSTLDGEVDAMLEEASS